MTQETIREIATCQQGIAPNANSIKTNATHPKPYVLKTGALDLGTTQNFSLHICFQFPCISSEIGKFAAKQNQQHLLSVFRPDVLNHRRINVFWCPWMQFRRRSNTLSTATLHAQFSDVTICCQTAEEE